MYILNKFILTGLMILYPGKSYKSGLYVVMYKHINKFE